MRTSLGLLLALTLPLSACGSGDPETEAYDALNSGDYQTAVAKFEAAASDVDASAAPEDYAELMIGRCRALAHVDAEKAKTEFLALADEAELEPGDYSMVASELIGADELLVAIDLFHEGMKKFEDNSTMVQLKDKVLKMASNNDAANDKLKGLGYL